MFQHIDLARISLLQRFRLKRMRAKALLNMIDMPISTYFGHPSGGQSLDVWITRKMEITSPPGLPVIA